VRMAVVAPATTVTVEGTVAIAVLPLASLTIAPPAGAGPFRVTIAVEALPPVTDEGLSFRETGTGALTAKVPVCVVPLKIPEIVTVAWLETAKLATVSVAAVAPAAIVTLPGTVTTEVLLLVNVTSAPPVGAALLSVTVPVDNVPPVTEAGLRLKELRTGAVTVSVALAPEPL